MRKLTQGRRGTPGPVAGRIAVAALAAGAAALAIVAGGSHGHGPATRLSAASAQLRSGGSGSATRQAAAGSYPGPGAPAAVLSTPLAPPQATTITARGSITCQSGRAVTGVWLVGLNGGSGWATWTARATSPQFAAFSRSIPAGGWSVHVGCGGSPASWEEAIYSGWVSGTSHDFTCADIPGRGQYGRCSARVGTSVPGTGRPSAP
jgi:hypothetical protein